MNNNNKGYFNIAKRNAAKGQKSTKFGNKTFNFKAMPRRSKFAKVARKGSRNKNELEQEEINLANSQEIARLKNLDVAEKSELEVKQEIIVE